MVVFCIKNVDAASGMKRPDIEHPVFHSRSEAWEWAYRMVMMFNHYYDKFKIIDLLIITK